MAAPSDLTDRAACAPAKAGVIRLARNLAVEWGLRGVRVNAISLGLIDAPLAAPLLGDAPFTARRMAMTPLRRPGTAADVVGAALFRASPAAASSSPMAVERASCG